MRATVIAVALVVLCAASPVDKVLELLGSLEVKITAEGAASKKAFEEYSAFCHDRSMELGFEITTGQSEVADLQAAIEKGTASIEQLGAKIDDTAAQIAADESDLKAATVVRAEDAAAFAAEEKELLATIDALERAINILSREAQAGSATMLQVQQATSVTQAIAILLEASALRSQDAATLTTFVQAQDEHESFGAPDAAVYVSHSGSIIDTLEGLLEKAHAQISSARQAETTSLHNFALLKQSLTDSVKYGGQELAEAKNGLAAASEAKATNAGDLDVTSKALAANEKAKATLEQDCATKAAEFEAESKSRAEELKAVGEAKAVISEKTGGAAGITYSFTQVSFLQTAEARTRTGLASFEVVRFVRGLARQQHSEALAQLSRRMASAFQAGAAGGADPFEKVKGLIAELIARLEDEASADATKKAYCDKETADTLAKQADKQALVDKLTTTIDAKTARSAQLKEQVAALEKALSNLAATQAKMDQLRSEESALYAKNKPEMEAGIEGVAAALNILREYYAEDNKAHEAAVGSSTGIIGLLEVIESDFTKGLAEMTAVETAAQADYEQGTQENKLERTAKEKDVEYKTKEIGQLATDLGELASDRGNTQAELSAILEYKAKLGDECIPKAETYEQKSARRAAEITGLKEALSMLEAA